MSRNPAVISLEEYRRRRVAAGAFDLAPTPALVWAPVVCWICWWPVAMVP